MAEKDDSRRVSIGWRVVKHEKRSKIVFVSFFPSFSSRLSCYNMREMAVYIQEGGIRKLKPRSSSYLVGVTASMNRHKRN